MGLTDKNSPMEGDLGQYPGTYDSKNKFNYNGLEIGLTSNYGPAMEADHSRKPDEAISAIASRGLKGPKVQPYGESRAEGGADFTK